VAGRRLWARQPQWATPEIFSSVQRFQCCVSNACRCNVDIDASLYHCIGMRTTLTIDNEVYRKIRIMSQSSGKRLGEVVSELLRQRLDGSPPSPGDGLDDGFDFITFASSGKTIRSAEVERILEEEI